jgi:30S ribosomal protein S31
MGKGDRRTRKGKIWRGTSGVSRPRKKRVVLTVEKGAKKKK